MTHDIVIRGGEIVDGTGSDPVPGDLAIDGSTISAVGQVDGSGQKEIDAEGHLVTPGFVDLHTHLDAQIGWDPFLTPVSWHGVTSVLMGNCGVTFAPCKPSDRELLAGMMETVEDIPKYAILNGLAWDWEDYGGYLDSIGRLQPAINVAGLVGHCAVRFYVMGERAVEEQASAEERQCMADIVAQSIDAGAVGFSTNRYAPHKLPDGRSIPGTFADPEELVAIARAVGPRNALMQAVGAGPEVLDRIASTTDGRILFSYGAGPEDESGRQRSEMFDRMRAGRDMTAISQVRGSGFMFGLQSRLPVQGETWDRLRGLDLAGRLLALEDAGTRAALVQEAREEGAMRLPVDQVYYLGADEMPDYTVPAERHLAALASAAGEHWSETFLRLSLETGGRALFNLRMFNRNLKALGDLFRNENIFPSLGDAGAHVSQIMDAGWTSFILSYWVREAGLYSVGEAVRRMTSGPARVMGLQDRGVLRPGTRADVNVLDPDTVAERQPELVHDFPGGAPRYIQKAVGYKATLVNGQVAVADGEHTGARAGEVLRHAG
ncbi:MAG: amidohydrolase family protein [Gammaproteobacteria bacterium]|nr:amidohydrolase family protein [Gammaproteobacteria bacterium]